VIYSSRGEIAPEVLSIYGQSDTILRDVVVPLPVFVNESCFDFTLEVDPGPTSNQDWAFWIAAYIEYP
jgi:hypothetical protein